MRDEVLSAALREMRWDEEVSETWRDPSGRFDGDAVCIVQRGWLQLVLSVEVFEGDWVFLYTVQAVDAGAVDVEEVGAGVTREELDEVLTEFSALITNCTATGLCECEAAR